MFGPRRRDPVPVRLGRAGVVAFASRHADGFVMAEVAHPFVKLLVVCGGSGHVEAGDHRASLVPGQVLWVPARVRHRLVDGADPLRLLGVCAVEPSPGTAAGDVSHEVERRLADLCPVMLDDGMVERSVRNLLFEQIERRPGWEAALCAHWITVQVALLRSLRRAQRHRAVRGDGVVRAIAWLDEHWHLPLSLGELAKRAGMPVRTFTAAVRQRTGGSVKDRLHRLRLSHAERMLRAGSPVLDAALGAGFNDLGHFYRVFRVAHGRPPAQWARETLRTRR